MLLPFLVPAAPAFSKERIGGSPPPNLCQSVGFASLRAKCSPAWSFTWVGKVYRGAGEWSFGQNREHHQRM